ncbi:hypothetical protein J4205_03285 [Candidatus Pacearchaeota archaeon]|nr:hypothetical protein [Candidatus Pacearchaeota archaeon]
MKRNPDEEYRLAFISGLAVDCLIDGINARRQGDYDVAKKYFAAAWASNCKQEYKEGMEICDRLLRSLDLGEFELMKLHEFGTSRVDYSISLLTCVKNKFSKKRTFNFTPSFEFS